MQVSMTINREDAGRLSMYLNSLLTLTGNPDPLLKRIGAYYVSETKQRFVEADWPAKLWIFEYWERKSYKGKLRDVPLTYTGSLMRSIMYQLRGAGVAIGSPLPYAARHQYGDDEHHLVWFPIIPEYEKGPRGGRRLKMFDGTQIPKGRLTIFQDPEAIHVPMLLKITARPYLHPPNERQWGEIYDICEQVLLRASGMGDAGFSAYFGPEAQA